MIGSVAMYDEELVRCLFPEAEARPDVGDSLAVFTRGGRDACRLGSGTTAEDAWAAAALRLSQDPWFRPIIRQLLARRSERRGGS